MVWNTLLEPLFSNGNQVTARNQRKVKAFVRYTVGNLFVLTKNNIDVSEIVGRLGGLMTYDNYVTSLLKGQKGKKEPVDTECVIDQIKYHQVIDFTFDQINNLYQNDLRKLYENKKIDANEYYNSKNMVIMIPPNILKKDSY